MNRGGSFFLNHFFFYCSSFGTGTDLISSKSSIVKISGTKNEICVSLVYSGNEKKNFISYPLYTRETQILFFVPAKFSNTSRKV
jgi:hypothetical protein